MSAIGGPKTTLDSTLAAMPLPVSNNIPNKIGKSLEKRRRDDSGIPSSQLVNQQNTEMAQRQAQTQEDTLDHLRDSFERQYSNQENYQDGKLQEVKDKDYEDLQALKKQNHDKMVRIRREGEDQIATLKNYYRSETGRIDRSNRLELAATDSQNIKFQDFEKKKSATLIENITAQNQERLKGITEQSDFQTNDLKEKRTTAYQQMLKNSDKSLENTEDKLTQKYNAIKQSSQDTENRLQLNVNDRLEKLQKEALQNISNYENRLADPFYAPVDMQTELMETEDEFTLTANLPSYEQEHLSVHMQGSTLILSGTRQTKNDLDLGKQGSQSTASYQTFTKRFNLSFPVDAKKISKERLQDRYIVHIPKRFR